MRTFPKVIDSWSGRLANAYALWPLLPASIGGALMAWLSTTVETVNRFGAFGWASVGLVAFLIIAVGLAAIGFCREKVAFARATQNWNVKVDKVNPLRQTFENERLSVGDLSHPITKRVIRKTFRNCEIFGPQNILFTGCSLNKVSYYNCDFVIIVDSFQFMNARIFENCQLIDTEIWDCTIFAPQEMYDNFTSAMPGLIRPITYERPK